MLKHNEMCRFLVFHAYDLAVDRQLARFLDLFQNMLTSVFANPWVFVRGATVNDAAEKAKTVGKSEVINRIPEEIQARSGTEVILAKWLQDIPTDPHQIAEAVDLVHMLMMATYSYIRSQVCDQVELFIESFFKTPMLRRLDEDMDDVQLKPEDLRAYEERRKRIAGEMSEAQASLKEVDACLQRLQTFKDRTDMRF